MPEQIAKDFERPHGGIGGWREGVKKDRMRRRGADAGAECGWKISEAQFPIDLKTFGQLSGAAAMSEKVSKDRLPAMQIREAILVLEGEFEGFGRVIKADDTHLVGAIANRIDEGQGIGGRAESNIPNDEFLSRGADAVAQLQLLDVEGLGFGGGADDRVKSFAVAFGTQAEGSVGELDDMITIGHGLENSSIPGKC